MDRTASPEHRKLDDALYDLYAAGADAQGSDKITLLINSLPDANSQDTTRWERRYHAEVELREHRGTFIDGYSDDDIDHVFTRITRAADVRLICVWDIYDAAGFGGHSQYYVLADDDTVHELGGDLAAWLDLDSADPDMPARPGDPQDWRGARADFTLADLPVCSGHNWARRDDSGEA